MILDIIRNTLSRTIKKSEGVVQNQLDAISGLGINIFYKTDR